MWHGPVGDAVPFFTGLGFICPPRKDVPSFLQVGRWIYRSVGMGGGGGEVRIHLPPTQGRAVIPAGE